MNWGVRIKEGCTAQCTHSQTDHKGKGGLQSLLGNMSHNQLMQLIGPTGLGGLGGLGALAGPGLASLLSSEGPAAGKSSSSPSQSPVVTPTSTTTRLGSSQVPTTPITPSATSAVSPMASSATPVAPSLAAGAASPTQPIQLSDLQKEIATLPSGESLPQSTDELHNTLTSPQFQQAMSLFSSALASGQLGPLMNQFGLPTEAVDAANKGDVEAFAKAMETDSKSENDDEDMSLD
ncbi:hypothetical protein J4Q44_G00215270 [Coregonus suidteri]|uniref:DEUBAD domain-containing protein n=1 Tax=Coregonus suidteri TaxID=861788 RepID=A0AAN8QQT1_9TELE